MESCYTIGESFTAAPTNAYFQLHNHNDYEILFFLEGDAKYVVEDKMYTLEPGDLIIIRKHEFHRIYHNSPTPYRRAVLMVSPAWAWDQSFFRKFRSQLTVTPISLAVLHASRQISGRLPPRAGVIPVKWNQSAPWKMAFQSKSEGTASAMAEWARS